MNMIIEVLLYYELEDYFLYESRNWLTNHIKPDFKSIILFDTPPNHFFLEGDKKFHVSYLVPI